MMKYVYSSLQPERINPESGQKGYDIRSDVWSLGITMVTNSIYVWTKKMEDYLMVWML